ncbi:lipocalin-like domain-containing protein [Aquimarina mytili]|uniref:Lipocalin family protein n=1 Tax=Aquimarina mytili TaxID=874423 RepID=A0A937A495_9FLAO|nr:lipocalin family protein [Aquimarina mytili]MBL0684064.1 lipocalin family protein [Aquimarina mytili]
MKLKSIKTIFLIFILLYSCGQPDEYFIGKWQIVNVIENSKSIDLVENWMHLKNNGTFESYDGALKKKESGTWRYQLDEKRLFIDGEGEEADSEWILSIKNDTLFFHSASDDVYLIAKEIK